jgi:hypothetical protein
MAEYEIKKPFHTTDYWMALEDDYRQFRRNDGRRREFEGKAVEIIKQTTRKPFSYGLVPSLLRDALETTEFDVPHEFHTAHALCGLKAILEGVRWDAVYKRVGERLLFGTKDEYPQFAAADILGWRHARLVRNDHLLTEDRHECFVNLFKQIPHDACLTLDGTALPRVFAEAFPRKSQ